MRLDLKETLSVNIVIFVASIVLFAFLANFIWLNNLAHIKKEQGSHLDLVHHSTQALLESQQTLLHALGTQAFIFNKNMINSRVGKFYLDDVQYTDSVVNYLVLMDAKGKVKLTTSNFNAQKNKDLEGIIKSYQDLYSEASTQQHLVIGRTHIFDRTTLIVPIAKSIYDNKERLVGVVLAGLSLSNDRILSYGDGISIDTRTGILRGDGYWQVLLGQEVADGFYEQRIPQAELDRLTDANYSLDKQSLLTTLYQLVSSDQLVRSHKAIRYERSSQSLYIVEIESPTIIKSFMFDLLPVAGAFLLFNMVTGTLTYVNYKRQIESSESLLEQAMYDPLTTLPNGLYLRRAISEWMDDKNSKRNFSLLYVDIDNFKSVNVSHGQEFGDRVLVLVAQRLDKLLQNDSLLIRQAGNGFVFLMETIDEFVLENFSQDILYALSIPFMVEKNTFLLGGSIGIASYPRHGETLDELLSSAELALREAKKSLNMALVFTNEMETNNRYRMRVEQKLRQAIKQKLPYVVYQPQLDSKGQLYGVEVLVRWTDEELGEVNPASFVSIAESSGLIVALGELVLSKAFRELEQIQKRQKTKFQISLNVSIRQFMNDNFVEGLKRRIVMYNLDPAYLTLEITENLFIEDLDKMKPIFDELRDYSIKISLDDFGTGYSSLSMLTEITLDELKIDKNFVDNIDIDPQSLTMVKNIIAIGKNYNMAVLAEGVETVDQKEMLKRCGCDAFQGYFYSKPIMYYELEDYIKTFDAKNNVVRMTSNRTKLS